MIIVGWLIIAVAAWLLDSAIRNRPPIETLKEIVVSGTLPVTGKSYPAAAHPAAQAAPAAGTAAPSGTATGAVYSSAPVANLTPEQSANARAIASVAIARGLGHAGVVIGIMTAITESTLVNVAHGDAMGPSSRGLFQQMGPWGPLAVRMDPAGSAGLFFDRLTSFNWRGMAPWAAAQKVQESEFSNGSNYQRNLAQAETIAKSLGY